MPPGGPQVDLMARQLERDGERVLVVLPERYLRPCVPNSARSRRGKVDISSASFEVRSYDLTASDRNTCFYFGFRCCSLLRGVE